jgi:hypothetical protein
MIARDVQRSFVYHSPQYPGFTCWCGLWTMPDDSVMCSFTQATGPFLDRPRAPEAVRRKLSWPPAGHENSEHFDMTGLCMENVNLHSANLSRSWQMTGKDAFTTCMNGAAGQAETCLPDGRIVRGVWGRYLPYDDTPDDGYMQVSADLGVTWGPPLVINTDPGYAFFPKRLHALADGSLLVGGGRLRMDPLHDARAEWDRSLTPVLYRSLDGGQSWSGPISVVSQEWLPRHGFTEEFDWTELEGGDLLVIFRAGVEDGRLQSILRRNGDGWDTADVTRTRMPYSGHPEVLGTAEGPVLHLATTGISCTVDQGATWQDVTLDDGLFELRKERPTPYYPKSVQMANGEVLVVGHVGGDNAYGAVDQSIVGLRFRLCP